MGTSHQIELKIYSDEDEDALVYCSKRGSWSKDYAFRRCSKSQRHFYSNYNIYGEPSTPSYANGRAEIYVIFILLSASLTIFSSLLNPPVGSFQSVIKMRWYPLPRYLSQIQNLVPVHTRVTSIPSSRSHRWSPPRVCAHIQNRTVWQQTA